MLLEQADPEDPRTRLLEKIERQTFRAAKIVNSPLHLSRPVQSETGPVDLHVVINDVLLLLEHQFRSASVQVRKGTCRPTDRWCAPSNTSCSKVSEPVPQRTLMPKGRPGHGGLTSRG